MLSKADTKMTPLDRSISERLKINQSPRVWGRMLFAQLIDAQIMAEGVLQGGAIARRRASLHLVSSNNLE